MKVHIESGDSQGKKISNKQEIKKMTTKVLNIDPDDIETIDQFINDFILSGEKLEISQALGVGKSEIALFLWLRILDRCIERNLCAKSYKHNYFKGMKAQIMRYTGDVMQQECIKQWMPNRKFYFCYNEATREDDLFSPGLPATVTAKVGDYLVLTTAGGFSAIREEEFKKDWVEIESSDSTPIFEQPIEGGMYFGVEEEEQCQKTTEEK